MLLLLGTVRKRRKDFVTDLRISLGRVKVRNDCPEEKVLDCIEEKICDKDKELGKDKKDIDGKEVCKESSIPKLDVPTPRTILPHTTRVQP